MNKSLSLQRGVDLILLRLDKIRDEPLFAQIKHEIDEFQVDFISRMPDCCDSHRAAYMEELTKVLGMALMNCKDSSCVKVNRHSMLLAIINAFEAAGAQVLIDLNQSN